MDDARRILVLGAGEVPPGVTAIEWSVFPPDLDVADYDVVIVSLVGAVTSTASLPQPADWARVAFRSNTELIFITPGETLSIENGQASITPMGWLPDAPPCFRRQGTTVREVVDGWQFYFDRLGETTYCVKTLGEIGPNEAPAHLGGMGDSRFRRGPVHALAKNRSGESLAYSTNLVVLDSRGLTRVVSSPIVWLPPLPELSNEETVALLLRERYGIATQTPPPSWANDHRLPAEDIAASGLEKAERALGSAQTALDEAREAASIAARWQPLIYEQGDPLADLVREALHELGAQVEPFEERYFDDGRFRCPKGRLGLIEVRGKKGDVEKTDVTQVADSVHHVLTDEEVVVKGVLVMNARRLLAPGESRAGSIGANETARAKRHKVVVLTTMQIHDALRAKQLGGFDQDAFWDAVMETDGLCDLLEIGA